MQFDWNHIGEAEKRPSAKIPKNRAATNKT